MFRQAIWLKLAINHGTHFFCPFRKNWYIFQLFLFQHLILLKIRNGKPCTLINMHISSLFCFSHWVYGYKAICMYKIENNESIITIYDHFNGHFRLLIVLMTFAFATRIEIFCAMNYRFQHTTKTLQCVQWFYSTTTLFHSSLCVYV